MRKICFIDDSLCSYHTTTLSIIPSEVENDKNTKQGLTNSNLETVGSMFLFLKFLL